MNWSGPLEGWRIPEPGRKPDATIMVGDREISVYYDPLMTEDDGWRWMGPTIRRLIRKARAKR